MYLPQADLLWLQSQGEEKDNRFISVETSLERWVFSLAVWRNVYCILNGSLSADTYIDDAHQRHKANDPGCLDRNLAVTFSQLKYSLNNQLKMFSKCEIQVCLCRLLLPEYKRS